MKIESNKTLIVGDIHAEWAFLNGLISKKRPDVVMCCGDFGYWPKIGMEKTQDELGYKYTTHFKDLKYIKRGDTDAKIFWCPGNHEHWWILDEAYGRRGLEPIAMNDFVYYCPIGSVLELNDKRVLFVGGADSVDKDRRTLGVNWFPEEVLTNIDYEYICDNVIKPIDIVISHTCPNKFPMARLSDRYDKRDDPSRSALSAILEEYKPTEWYFGHWHFYQTEENYGCKWTALDYPKHQDRWWIEK